MLLAVGLWELYLINQNKKKIFKIKVTKKSSNFCHFFQNEKPQKEINFFDFLFIILTAATIHSFWRYGTYFSTMCVISLINQLIPTVDNSVMF